ncbi:MAG: hypothetical protein V1792_04795 [Pseudomonadota bacterium]
MVARVTGISPGLCTAAKGIKMVRRNSTKGKSARTLPIIWSWSPPISVRPLKWILLGALPTLVLLTNAFGVEWSFPPRALSLLPWFRVGYDPKLTDPFFKSNEWSYPWYIIKHPDGHFEDTTSGIRPEKEPPRLKRTARCFSNSYGEWHVVSFCEARFVDGHNIDLFIHDHNPSFSDALMVRISNGMFKCMCFPASRILSREKTVIVAETTRQKLILDKKVYRKGDVIKGRIDFELVEEVIDEKHVQEYSSAPKTIQVFGVFKTIVH